MRQVVRSKVAMDELRALASAFALGIVVLVTMTRTNPILGLTTGQRHYQESSHSTALRVKWTDAGANGSIVG